MSIVRRWVVDVRIRESTRDGMCDNNSSLGIVVTAAGFSILFMQNLPDTSWYLFRHNLSSGCALFLLGSLMKVCRIVSYRQIFYYGAGNREFLGEKREFDKIFVET